MNIKIKHLLRYDNAQRFVQTFNECYIIWVKSGVEYMNITLPCGEGFEAGDGTLLLLPRGTAIDFCFNEKRCNYSAACEIEDYVYDILENRNTLSAVNDLPFAVKIKGKRFDFADELFKRAEKLANSPIARNRMAAEVLLGAVLAEFIRQVDSGSADIPQTVLKLKKAIDEDFAFQHDIGELMAQIDCSAGHLRRQFKECYQIGIAEYRARVRLAKIKELMLDYRLSMKEIADFAGMKNVTHLHKFIYTHCHMTPRELRNSLGR